MKQAEQLYITLGERPIRIAVNMRHSGNDLVLFLHGLGCAKESFAGAFDCQALRGFSLCAFDFPGHGHSESDHDQDHSLPAYATIARSLVEHLRSLWGTSGRLFLVGHSMGGSVGLLAAQDIPSLTHYVSVEGNLVAEDCGLVSRWTANQLGSQFITAGYRSFQHELASSERPDLRAWARWYGEADPIAIHRSARSLVEWSDSGKLLNLFREMPQAKTYVHGADEDKSHLLPYLADCQVKCIPEAGHFLMVDNPQDFYGTLVETLSRPTSRPYAGR